MSVFGCDPFFTFAQVETKKDGKLLMTSAFENRTFITIEDFIKFAPSALRSTSLDPKIIVAVQPVALGLLLGGSDDLSFLKQLTRLERLEMEMCYVLGEGEHEEKIVFDLDWIPTLTHFKCDEVIQNEIDVNKFEGYLSVRRAEREMMCSQLKCGYIEPHSSFPNLVSLDVYRLPDNVGAFPCLEYLSVGYIPSKLPSKLRVLRMHWCHFARGVDFGENNVEELWIDSYPDYKEPKTIFETFGSKFSKLNQIWVDGKLVHGTTSLVSKLSIVLDYNKSRSVL